MEGVFETLDAYGGQLFLRAKQMGSWMNIWGTTVNVTVLLTMQFSGFCVHVTMLPPLTFKINVMVALGNFLYVTYLAAETQVSSSRIITRCVTIFSTLHNEPSPPTSYVTNPSSNSATVYQSRIYIRGWQYWRLQETSSSRAYGKVKLIPSLMSDSGPWTVIPTRRSQ